MALIIVPMHVQSLLLIEVQQINMESFHLRHQVDR